MAHNIPLALWVITELFIGFKDLLVSFEAPLLGVEGRWFWEPVPPLN
jgi:hypothetical protein